MPAATLLVSFEAEPERRHVIETACPDSVEVVYLDDEPPADRPATVAAADAILTFAPHRELDDDAFARLHGDQLLQTVSAGVDHLPFDRFPDGLTVLSNAGAYAEPIAEHVLALYLALAKRLHVEDRKLRDGVFDQHRRNRWVAGSTCAIVGFGAIGEAAAELLSRLDVTILAINRSGESDREPAFLGTPDDLEEVLRRSDGLVLAAPLTADTRGMIDAEALSWLGEDALLVNVGRGELIDQGDLYDHLRRNPEFQAGLEAWWTEPPRDGEFSLEYPLLDLPNVLGCPHNSARVPDILERGHRRAVENVIGAIAEEEPENVVDRERGY